MLIGIDEYEYAADLEYCGADQRELGTYLTKSGFDARRVLLLHDKATDRKFLPFRSNIVQQIELACGLVKPGDLVLIGFSGHGVHRNDTSYLCPTDAKLDDESTLISLDWIYDQLRKSQADLRLVMIDACRDVPPRVGGIKSFSAISSSRQFVKSSDRVPEGVLMLNSCAEGEFSWEDPKLQHGVFMHFVIQGLQGAADGNADLNVTLGELISYTSDETELYVRDRWGELQRPRLFGDVSGKALKYVLIPNLQSAQDDKADAPRPPMNSSGPKDPIIGTQTGEILSDNTLQLKLVWCDAGQFKRGSNAGWPGERPVRKITLTDGFWIGQTEITQKQWYQVMETEPWSEAKYTASGASFPATYVSWDDAMKFCRKLTDIERRLNGLPRTWVYTLPTEAQWEYACRAGTATAYSFGELHDKSGDYAWFISQVPVSERHAQIVAKKRPNSWELYDMHGNVSEWCRDYYGYSYYATSPAVDPSGPADGQERVARGGGWRSWTETSASRHGQRPTYTSSFQGFRLALVKEHPGN